jgi:hypothetical protein
VSEVSFQELGLYPYYYRARGARGSSTEFSLGRVTAHPAVAFLRALSCRLVIVGISALVSSIS